MSRPPLSHLSPVTLLLLVEVIADVILDRVAVPGQQSGVITGQGGLGGRAGLRNKPVGHEGLGLASYPGQGLTGPGLGEISCSNPSHRADHLDTVMTVLSSYLEKKYFKSYVLDIL